MPRALVRVVVIIVALVATACSAGVTSGTIVAKTFSPAHNGFWMWCHPAGKITVCQPMPIYYGDRWTFTLQSGESEGNVDVTKEVYDSHKVGDLYTVPQK